MVISARAKESRVSSRACRGGRAETGRPGKALLRFEQRPEGSELWGHWASVLDRGNSECKDPEV